MESRLYTCLLFLLGCVVFVHSQRPPGDGDDEDFVFAREGSGQRVPPSGGVYHPPPSSSDRRDYGSVAHAGGGRGSSPLDNYGSSAVDNYGSSAVDNYGYGNVAHGPDAVHDDDDYGSGEYYDEEDYEDYPYDDYEYEDEDDDLHGVSVGEMDDDRHGDTAGSHPTDTGGGYHDPVSEDISSHDIGVVHAGPPQHPRQPEPTQQPDPSGGHNVVYGGRPDPDPQSGADTDDDGDFLEDWEAGGTDTGTGTGATRDNDLVVAPDVAVPADDTNKIQDGTVGGQPSPTPASDGMGAKALDRDRSFFAQPGILAAVVGGAVVGLLCAILLVMLIVYRMRKKDEGSYALDEPKRSLTGNSYAKNNNREFYA